MNKARTYRAFRLLVGFVWFVNGLFCKVLNIVPRHRMIVSRILGEEHAATLTSLIGISEVLMAVWVWSGLFRQLNVLLQMLLIGSMNVLEAILAPDLLLWGRANALFAFIFILLIYYNEFYLGKYNKP